MFTSGAKGLTGLLMHWAAGHGNSAITTQETEVAPSGPSILQSHLGGERVPNEELWPGPFTTCGSFTPTCRESDKIGYNNNDHLCIGK